MQVAEKKISAVKKPRATSTPPTRLPTSVQDADDLLDGSGDGGQEDVAELNLDAEEPRSPEPLEEQPTASRKKRSTLPTALFDETLTYTEAHLRPGYLLLTELSRPGGVKYERRTSEDGLPRSKRVVKDAPTLEKMSGKICNTAYAKLTMHFANTPFGGFFCEEHELEHAQTILNQMRPSATFLNNLAREMGSSRRVRIELYPIEWDHTDPVYRRRIGEMIAMKLIDLRACYTTTELWAYRVRMDRVRWMDKLVLDDEAMQSTLIKQALQATERQRRIMTAIYGDRPPPVNWMDPSTGKLKPEVQLDFGPIDRAIKHFCPGWEPTAAANEDGEVSELDMSTANP